MSAVNAIYCRYIVLLREIIQWDNMDIYKSNSLALSKTVLSKLFK